MLFQQGVSEIYDCKLYKILYLLSFVEIIVCSSATTLQYSPSYFSNVLLLLILLNPLDMRMNPQEGQSAQEWLATADQKSIAKVIKEYGEERYALSIAKAIIASRDEGVDIRSTRQLATLVASVVRTRDYDQDPATRTFQAIRIHINQELSDLEKGLTMSLNLLKPKGRLVVISFHSLEDRMVKQFMQQHSKASIPRGLPLRESELPKSPMRLIGRIKPSSFEIQQNPRSRSAVMRIAEMVGQP